MPFFKQTSKKGRFWPPKEKMRLVICALILALILAPGIYITLEIRAYKENVMMGEGLDAITDQVWKSSDGRLYLWADDHRLDAWIFLDGSWQRFTGGRRSPAYLSFTREDSLVFEGSFSLDPQDPNTAITLLPYKDWYNNPLTHGEKAITLQPLQEGDVPPWAAR